MENLIQQEQHSELLTPKELTDRFPESPWNTQEIGWLASARLFGNCRQVGRSGYLIPVGKFLAAVKFYASANNG